MGQIGAILSEDMIYFIYGRDTYRSRRKLGEIIAAFRAAGSGSDAGLTRVDAEDDPSAVFTVGRTSSLLSGKELFVIERASASSALAAAYIEREMPRWAKERGLTIVFWEGELSGKSRFGDNVRKYAAKSQEFKSLSPAAAGRWLGGEAARLGVRITSDEQRLLFSLHGSDLFALSGELDKIRHGWRIGDGKREDVEVWDFTDVFLKARRSSYPALAGLFYSGVDGTHILSALAGAARALALVWKGLNGGGLKSLTASLHPFVANKSMEPARRINAASLRRLFDGLVRADVEFKTGRLPASMPLEKLALGGKRKTAA